MACFNIPGRQNVENFIRWADTTQTPAGNRPLLGFLGTTHLTI